MFCLKSLFASLCLVALTALPARCQTTGSIYGAVSDESGAAVPNGTVKVVNERTGLAWTVQSADDGTYLVLQLPNGVYTVEASAPGFKVYIRKDIPLSVQQNVKVDLPLQVGEVSESVTITGEAPLVDTRQASLASIMDSRRMTEMPLNGRSVASLLLVVPGVSRLGESGNTPTSNRVSANIVGGRGPANNFLLDNARFNAVQNNEGNPLPPPDVVAEFRVETNSYDAEKGMASAATIQVVTRTGRFCAFIMDWNSSIQRRPPPGCGRISRKQICTFAALGNCAVMLFHNSSTLAHSLDPVLAGMYTGETITISVSRDASNPSCRQPVR